MGNCSWRLLGFILFLVGISGILAVNGMAGSLEPPGAPGATMHTLEEIYQKLEVIEKKVDQVMEPRFTDLGDGTIRDNKLKLRWLKNANCFGQLSWNEALNAVNGLQDGQCGLTDGSSQGQWRLPKVEELTALLSYANTNTAIIGEAKALFENEQPSTYWTGTEYVGFSSYQWIVNLNLGEVLRDLKTTSNASHYVMAVRVDE